MVKKIIALIIAALISMPFLFILPACTPSLEFGTLTICSEINQETGEPQDSKEIFTIENTSFYASMRASGVKADDNYRYTVKEKSEDITIYDETWTYSTDDNGFVEGYFYLEYEGNDNKLLIQPGEYVVDYYHQGELIDSASFKVLPPEVKITEISLARSIDEQTMAPTDTTAEFEPGDNIYATVRLNNSVAGDYFEARWYYGQEPIIEKTVDIEQNYFEESYIAFSLTSEESWQPGGYSVEIYYNGNQHGTYDFMVAGPELEEASEEYPFSQGLIYTNEDYNFQFAVPDGWEISENIEEDGLGVELKYAAEQIPVAIVFMASNPESALPEEDYKVQSDELAAEAASASELELIEEIQGEDINSFNIPFHEYSYKYNDAEGREFGMVFDFFKGADRTYVLFIFSLEDYYDMVGQLYDGIVNSFNYIE